MNDDPDVIAEYVLGTLPAEERARFSARLRSDPALREAVREWEARLSPLDASAAAETPRAEVWEAIERAAFGHHARTGAQGENVIRLKQRLALWRGAALISGALAAALAVFVVDRLALTPAVESGRYVAVVDSGGHEPALIAEVDTKTGTIRIRSLTAETPPGHSLELWHIPEGKSPRSLGVLKANASGQTIRDALAKGATGGVIAVTVEPEGGSPSGAPTGPAIYTGKLIPVD